MQNLNGLFWAYKYNLLWSLYFSRRYCLLIGGFHLYLFPFIFPLIRFRSRKFRKQFTISSKYFDMVCYLKFKTFILPIFAHKVKKQKFVVKIQDWLFVSGERDTHVLKIFGNKERVFSNQSSHWWTNLMLECYRVERLR